MTYEQGLCVPLGAELNGWEEVNGGVGIAGKAGEWQKVLKLSADMQRSGVQPDVWTYASLIAACQSCGNRWREALNFYQDMQDKGVRSCIITGDSRTCSQCQVATGTFLASSGSQQRVRGCCSTLSGPPPSV